MSPRPARAAVDDEAEQVRQQKLEEERRRAAAAHKAAEHKGIDAKTKKQVKYCAGKLAAWLEVHGAYEVNTSRRFD